MNCKISNISSVFKFIYAVWRILACRLLKSSNSWSPELCLKLEKSKTMLKYFEIIYVVHFSILMSKLGCSNFSFATSILRSIYTWSTEVRFCSSCWLHPISIMLIDVFWYSRSSCYSWALRSVELTSMLVLPKSIWNIISGYSLSDEFSSSSSLGWVHTLRSISSSSFS